MSELPNLLQASITEFEDHEQNCSAIPTTYFPGSDGLAYLIKNDASAKFISAAVHLNVEAEPKEDGIYDTGIITVDTQDDIFSMFEEQPQIVILSLTHVGDQFKMGFGPYLNPYHSFAAGQVVTGATSGATGMISKVSLNDDQISGWLYIGEVIGKFADGEALTVKGTAIAPASVYEGFILGISKSGEYNEEAKTWHYSGEILLTRNSQFVVSSTPLEPMTAILTDSTVLWLGLELGVPVYPSFISGKNIRHPYISVKIEKSEPLGPPYQEVDNEISQYKKDTVKLYLVNATADQAQKILKTIWEAPEMVGTFGINNFPGWTTLDHVQPGFGIKGNVRAMDIVVNYTLVTSTADVIKYITKFAATIGFDGFSATITNI